jgi:hypothetical protein
MTMASGAWRGLLAQISPSPSPDGRAGGVGSPFWFYASIVIALLVLTVALWRIRRWWND